MNKTTPYTGRIRQRSTQTHDLDGSRGGHVTIHTNNDHLQFVATVRTRQAAEELQAWIERNKEHLS